jgi:hypothetical protein
VVGGKPSISDAAADAVTDLASNAFAAVTAPSNLPNVLTLYNNVSNNYNTQKFEIVAGGTELLGYHDIVILGTTAQVYAELEPWEVFREYSESGFKDRLVINKTVVQAELTQAATGNWLVESEKFQYVPGFGP